MIGPWARKAPKRPVAVVSPEEVLLESLVAIVAEVRDAARLQVLLAAADCASLDTATRDRAASAVEAALEDAL